MSVHDIRYAYSLKSDASCLNGAPRAPTQCQAFAKMLIRSALVFFYAAHKLIFGMYRHGRPCLRYGVWREPAARSAPDQTAKGKRLLHEARGSRLRSDFSSQDAEHRLHSSLDSLLNVKVLLQMRRICWQSFSITPQHLSHHLCSVLYNKALFQDQKKAPSPSCFYVIPPASNYGPH